jgi:hypothetical protein
MSVAMAPYSELVYFEGAHFAHIAAFAERNRLGSIRDRLRAFEGALAKPARDTLMRSVGRSRMSTAAL